MSRVYAKAPEYGLNGFYVVNCQMVGENRDYLFTPLKMVKDTEVPDEGASKPRLSEADMKTITLVPAFKTLGF